MNWLKTRIIVHQKIRDDLVSLFINGGFQVRKTEGGSYLFPLLPKLKISSVEFIERLRFEDGIIVTPGCLFGNDSKSRFRINFPKTTIRQSVQWRLFLTGRSNLC